MVDWRRRFGGSKSETSLLVLFIPSVNRDSQPIDQEVWVDEALVVLGRLFGGATAFPRARGVWRDDEHDGNLVFDRPIVVHCYTSETALERHAVELAGFLRKMGQETEQGAVGFVIDNMYLEIEP